jgi:hypothetical protein
MTSRNFLRNTSIQSGTISSIVFGGVTAFLRSPGVGLWKTDDDVSRDEVVMFEVMSPDLDEQWWHEISKKIRKEIPTRRTLGVGFPGHEALSSSF